jgi:hypothetical protein
MPTVQTRSIGSGRDYATLQLAWDDIAAIAGSTDLVSEDVQVVFEVHDDAIYTERVDLDGLTTDAARNVIVRKGSVGRPRWQPSSGTGHVFTIQCDFLVLEDLDIFQYSGAATSNECIRLNSSYTETNAGVTLRRVWCKGDRNVSQLDCIYAGNRPLGNASNPVRLENCLLQGAQRAVIHSQQYGAEDNDHYWELVNCLLIDSANYGFGWRAGDPNSVITALMVNTIIANADTACVGDTGSSSGSLETTGSTNNFDTDGTIAGAGSPNPVTATDNADPGAGDWIIFQDITGGYDDLRLVDDSDNDVLGLGVGPTANALVPADDFDGNPRSGATTDPGPFERVVGGGTAITPNDLTAPAAVLDTPALGQTHALSPSDLAAPSAQLDSPSIGQTHVLAPADLVAPGALLDTPAIGQVHVLSPLELVAPAPVLDAPALGQTHALSPNDLTAPPAVLDSPAIGTDGSDAVVPNDLVAPPAVLDSPAIGQTHVLAPTDLVGPPAQLDSPAIAQVHELSPLDLTAPAPVLDAPALGQVHALAPSDLTASPAELDTPSIGVGGQVLAPLDLVAPAAVLDSPAIGQVHVLSPLDLTAPAAVLDTPWLGSDFEDEILELVWSHTPANSIEWSHTSSGLVWSWAQAQPTAARAFDETFSQEFD